LSSKLNNKGSFYYSLSIQFPGHHSMQLKHMQNRTQKLIRKNFLKLFTPSMTAKEAKIRIVYATLLLGTALPVWGITEGIAPQIVRAYTARADIVIDRLPEETYETMLRRAEAAARAGAQRSFDQDILITEVSVIISGQNYGAIAPILDLRVNRQQWRNRPDPQVWATYFKSARSLLLFDQKQGNTEAAAPTASTPK
jgi:hypothetical protein